MSNKARLSILLACIVLFLVITPWLILKSVGYRVDVKNQHIVATGGIYVRAEPSGTEVIVDKKINEKSGIFSNYVFIQNLLPQEHNVLVKKDNYRNYEKKILVKGGEVTKIENIILFKDNIAWENLNKIMAKTIFPAENPVKKNIIAYTTHNNSLIWLGQDGNVNQSDTENKNNQILTSSPILIEKKNSYKIFANDFGIFILKNKDLLLLDKTTRAFNIFLFGINDVKISPDNQNIFYATDNEIWLNHSNYADNNYPKIEKRQPILLNRFYEKISNIFWLNNNYLIMQADPSTSSGQVKISEIDNRGNINIIDLQLPKDFLFNSKSQIYFDQTYKKLYILSENNFIASEKLLP